MNDLHHLSKKQVIACFPDQSRDIYSICGLSNRAAVLVPLLEKENEWHLLLTKRTDFLPTHKGQIAFPGGRAEIVDIDPFDTALRETKEEVGIGNEQIVIAGRLHEFVTPYGVIISPVVGIINWPIDLTLSTNEVSRVFTIPLVWFADQKNMETREYLEAGSPPRQVLYYREYHGDIVWGITAFIIRELINTLKK